MKKPIKILLAVLLILILIVGAYAAYVFITYYRIEDNQPLTAEGQGAAGDTVPTSKEMTLTSWNIGFGAYTEQFSFFMDGGKYSRGFSEEIVKDTVISISDTLKEMQSDFIFLQEVDIDATRSYHIDQRKIMQSALNNMSSVFALNYDSPYLFWPLLEPHGKSVAGILTLSNYDISTGLRRSLPIQTDFAKLIDLDRCYTVSRVPTENGKELLLYNVHLSAYTTDPTIADKQLDMLYEDMAGEYQKGNYILCGGDFNKDLLGDSSQVFGISGEDYSWAQSFPFDTVPEGFSLVAPFDQAIPVPSCRNADAPWDPETNFQLTVDGFIVSNNIKVSESLVIDTDFKYSDHNPVQITFTLIS